MKKEYSLWIIRLLLIGAMPAGLSAAPLPPGMTPEQQTLRISRLLKPIGNDEWKQIAGEKADLEYSVVKGDTLYDVSGRLFGDSRYWPKVWALNNGKVKNAHKIFPGQMIAFMPGSGSSLPGFSGVNGAGATATDAPAALAANGRPTEWQRLPRQSWEDINVRLPPEVDPLGFDRRNKIVFHKSLGYDLPVFATTEKLESRGEIIGSRAMSTGLTLNDIVFISPATELEIEKTYSVTNPPQTLKSSKATRSGLAYHHLGKVKVIGFRDGRFIGRITSAYGRIERGSILIDERPRFSQLEPKPGPAPIEGVLMFDPLMSSSSTAQHKFVHIDRGATDGVEPGMVFRHYQHSDPATDKSITDADFVIIADFQVVDVSETFSTALALATLNPVSQDSTAVLLTDVTDVYSHLGFQKAPTGQDQIEKELDELEGLGADEGLTDAEKRELKQLEEWKENPPEGATEEAAPPAEGEELPVEEAPLVEMPPVEEAPLEEVTPAEPAPLPIDEEEVPEIAPEEPEGAPESVEPAPETLSEPGGAETPPPAPEETPLPPAEDVSVDGGTFEIQ